MTQFVLLLPILIWLVYLLDETPEGKALDRLRKWTVALGVIEIYTFIAAILSALWTF